MSTYSDLLKNGASLDDFVRLSLTRFGPFSEHFSIKEGTGKDIFIEAYNSSEAQKALLSARRELKSASRKMSKKQLLKLQRKFDKEYDEAMKRLAQKVNEYSQLQQKAYSLLEQIKNWTPPTENHIEFKETLMDHFENLIRSEFRVDYLARELVNLTRKKVATTVKDRISAAKRWIKRCEKECLEGPTQVLEAKKWVDELYYSSLRMSRVEIKR